MAYRAALKERTRDRVPLDWATTQNNLGNALETLGDRESGTARLEEAVVAGRLRWTDLTPLASSTRPTSLELLTGRSPGIVAPPAKAR